MLYSGFIKYSWFPFISAVFSVCFVPLIIKLCRRMNWYDRIDPRKIHDGEIPRLGGVAVFISFFIVSAIFLHVHDNQDFITIWPLFLGGTVIFISGVIDDVMEKGIPARVKFFFQIVSALVVALSPFNFYQFFAWNMPPVVGKIVTFCWILALENAYNLIDGIDMLSAGLSFFAFLSFSVVLMVCGKVQSIYCLILAGSVIGFLFWNKPPAKIFLGDCGSMTLGYAVAVAPLFDSTNETIDFNIMLIAALLSSIPVIDVIAAMIRRKRERRSFFSPDRGHIHHKLMNIGFSKRVILIFLFVIQFVVSITVIFAAVFASFNEGRRTISIVLFIALSFVVIFFIAMHYINRAVNLKMEGKLPEEPQDVF